MNSKKEEAESRFRGKEEAVASQRRKRRRGTGSEEDAIVYTHCIEGGKLKHKTGQDNRESEETKKTTDNVSCNPTSSVMMAIDIGNKRNDSINKFGTRYDTKAQEKVKMNNKTWTVSRLYR